MFLCVALTLVETFIYHVDKFMTEAKRAAKEQMAEEKSQANQHLKDCLR